MKKIAVIVAALFAANAYATNEDKYSTTGTTYKGGNSASKSNSRAQAKSGSRAQAVGVGGKAAATGGKAFARGGQGGSSHATGGSSNNSNEVTNGNTFAPQIDASTRIKNPRQVQSAYAPSVLPTADCSGASSAGVQTGRVGFSFGTSWTQEKCMEIAEEQHIAIVYGEPDMAAEMRCIRSEDYRAVREAMGKPCKVAPKPKEQQFDESIYRG